MSISEHFALPGSAGADDSTQVPTDAHIRAVRIDGSFYKGCMYGDVCWITKPFSRDSFFKHPSDEFLVFVGGDMNDPENLTAEIELWIENDKLTLTTTSIVFVPAGAAHGRITVRNVKKPVLHYTCHLNSDTYEEIPAEATAPKGTYAGNWVEKYAPVDGKMPTAPEGFLTPLLWIDGKKLKGASHMDTMLFNTKNDTGPHTHSHVFDEFFGFIGTDPEHPEELGAEVHFYIGDEYFSITKSCLAFIPRGTIHCPMLVPKLDRPIIMFSGGNASERVSPKSEPASS
jgi:mannose-6-phosphate isomerase-like protein (cupin superfamily)